MGSPIAQICRKVLSDNLQTLKTFDMFHRSSVVTRDLLERDFGLTPVHFERLT